MIKQGEIITDAQRTYLKTLISIWWDSPITEKKYNKSVQRVNKILKRGNYKLGGIDEKSIKDLMQWYTLSLKHK